MPWKESSVMDERRRFVNPAQGGESMASLCREFVIATWRKGLCSPSKTSSAQKYYLCLRNELLPMFRSGHLVTGGGRGIRTPERVTPLTVFKTAAFNHSAIPPLPMYGLGGRAAK